MREGDNRWDCLAWKKEAKGRHDRGVQMYTWYGECGLGDIFSLSQNTRTQWGHPMKLIGGRSRTNKRNYFFTHCIIKLWNSLPQDVVMSTNLDGFKKGLDKFLEEAINGY